MGFLVSLALGACKLSRKVIRLTGGGATSFPGKLATKICPDILAHLAKDVHTIIITGTNGKTTTSRMVEEMLKETGYDYFDNKSGANLQFGITAAFAENSTLSGRPKNKWAIIECDEAAFKQVGKFTDPDYVIVTNLFRDQLDRFGEISTTLENIKIGVANSPRAVLCLNADCSMTASIAEGIDNKVLFFGVNEPIYKERVRESSDAPYCIHCKQEYTYEYITYGHLGKYHCPGCGYSRPEPEVSVEKVLLSDENHSEIELRVGGESRKAVISLPGGYNIYNGVAAYCLAYAMNLDLATAVKALSCFECGFGRMEAFNLGEASTRMILIKNPAGCNQVLNFLTNLREKSLFAICLNDKYADGRDISWIWDVDFEILTRLEDKLDRILVSGIRAYDMALRLKYAGIDSNKLIVEQDYNKLLDTIAGQEKPVYIMPTYTSMMDLRALAGKRFGLKNFWE